MRNVMRTVIISLATGLALFPGSIAYAAPSNDEIQGAVSIPGLPFNDTRDTSEATLAVDDPPTSCFNPLATVWYTFTPSRTSNTALDTIGSDYDTTLAVFSGTPGALTLVTCNDDAVGLASGVAFTAEAGTRYFIMAGTCCGGEPGAVGPGGHLVLNAAVAPPPVTVSVAVNSRGTVTRSGTATISGSVTCTTTSVASIGVNLTQQFARFVAQGGNDLGQSCGPNPTPWSVQVSSFGGVVFGAGKVRADVLASACDAFTCDQAHIVTTVRLRRG